jgi:hypothetical protein
LATFARPALSSFAVRDFVGSALLAARTAAYSRVTESDISTGYPQPGNNRLIIVEQPIAGQLRRNDGEFRLSPL